MTSGDWRRARCHRLWQEQEGLCFYCQRSMAAPLTQRLRHRKRADAATIDHVMPLSLGGAADWPNEVAACRACNDAKADALPSSHDLERLQRLKEQILLAGLPET